MANEYVIADGGVTVKLLLSIKCRDEIFSIKCHGKICMAVKRSLDGWYRDLVLRIKQLQGGRKIYRDQNVFGYQDRLTLWLFNALMQATGRVRGLALDNMTVETHVSLMQTRDNVVDHPVDGAFIDGLYIEGARWGGYTIEDANVEEEEEEFEEEDLYEVSGTKCGGHLLDSRLKELLPVMPVVYVKAVQTQASWIATESWLYPPRSIHLQLPDILDYFQRPNLHCARYVEKYRAIRKMGFGWRRNDHARRYIIEAQKHKSAYQITVQ